jgi:hypothetical protein
MKSNRLIFLLTALILTLSNQSRSQNSRAEKTVVPEISQTEAFESLISTNSTRLTAAWFLDNQRREFIGKLMAILNGNSSDDLKKYVVIVLGEYRASEAVPFIVEHLEWDDLPANQGISIDGLMTSEFVESAIMPMRGALKNIGIPSIPLLLNKVVETDSTNETVKCVSVCRAIEGPEVTQFRLQGLLEKSTDLKRKHRIQLALKTLKDLDKRIHEIKELGK